MFIPLDDRVEMAQAHGAALFVSMHADALSDQRCGRERLYAGRYASDAQTAALARRENSADRFAGRHLQHTRPKWPASWRAWCGRNRVGSGGLARSGGQSRPDLPMLPNPERHAGFVVLKAADIPSVLVEMGFMSNPADEAELRRPRHRAQVADSDARAVDAYFAATARTAETIAANGCPASSRRWSAYREKRHIASLMSAPDSRRALAPASTTAARPQAQSPRKPRPRRGLIRRFARGVVGGLLGLVVLAVARRRRRLFAWQHFAAGLPDVDGLRNYQPPVMSRVYAGDGRLVAELATERRIFVPYTAIPEVVKQAFVSAEDQNFWTHPGVDPLAILRASSSTYASAR